MADLVDREEVLDVIFNIMTDNKASHKHRALNRNIKQVAVTLTNTERHAHWIKEKVEDITYPWYRRFCSNCKMQSPLSREHNYCPHCGCKMDEVSE